MAGDVDEPTTCAEGLAVVARERVRQRWCLFWRARRRAVCISEREYLEKFINEALLVQVSYGKKKKTPDTNNTIGFRNDPTQPHKYRILLFDFTLYILEVTISRDITTGVVNRERCKEKANTFEIDQAAASTSTPGQSREMWPSDPQV